MTKTKTYAYICVYSAHWCYDNQLHLRCANDGRIRALTKSATRFELEELPYAMTKQAAIAWFKQEFSENAEYMQAANFKPVRKQTVTLDSIRKRILNKQDEQAQINDVLAAVNEE